MTNQTDDEGRDYLRQMEEQRGYLLDFHRILAAEDLDFLKRYDALLQATYLDETTRNDARTKELILTAVLIAVRSPANHIETHMRIAKRLGVTRKEMLELLELCLPPTGVPAFMEGFAVWREVYEV